MNSAASRLGWLIDVAGLANDAARSGLETFGDDAMERDDAVLQICGEFLSLLISGLDNSVSNPSLEGLSSTGSGPIATLNARIAEVYHASAARVVVSGSSGANIMVFGALIPIACGRTGRMLCDRDSHLSLLGGLVVSGAETTWFDRHYHAEYDAKSPPNPSEIESLLLQEPSITAVCLTSPAYDGFDADIRQIAAICHKHGALLVVDHAWGACYGVLSPAGFPPSPLELGADIAVVSLHKKGFSPSQVGAVLFRDPEHARLFDIVATLGFTTTSPNFFLLASTESRIASLPRQATIDAWVQAIDSAEQIRRRIQEAHPSFKAIRPQMVGATSWDPCHVLIHVGDAGISGYALARALTPYKIFVEKATPATVLLLVSPAMVGRESDHILALRFATESLLPSATRGLHRGFGRPIVRTPAALTVREAIMAAGQSVGLDDAVGRICAAPVAVYPPGTAVLVPGEQILIEHVEYLRAAAAHGGHVLGIEMSRPEIRIVSMETEHEPLPHQ